VPPDETTGGGSTVGALAAFTASGAASPVGAGGAAVAQPGRCLDAVRQHFGCRAECAASRRIEALAVLLEQPHTRWITARKAVADHAGDDRPAGSANAGLDNVGRLSRVQGARRAFGAHHRVAQQGRIGDRLCPRGLDRGGRDAAAVGCLLVDGTAHDASRRRDEVRVEDRGQLLALVAVGRLAEQRVAQRGQLAGRRIGVLDGIGAREVVIGVGPCLQDRA